MINKDYRYIKYRIAILDSLLRVYTKGSPQKKKPAKFMTSSKFQWSPSHPTLL